jgi:hypothetical protein
MSELIRALNHLLDEGQGADARNAVGLARFRLNPEVHGMGPEVIRRQLFDVRGSAKTRRFAKPPS